jgi:hypothetical protein
VSQYGVLLDGSHGHHLYGPFDDKETAVQFAEFLTAEVDPAQVLRLIPPIDEMHGWWRSQRDRETDPAAAEGVWPPKLGDAWQDKNGDRWLAMPGKQLLHLAGLKGSAPYAEIWRLFGPLTLVNRTQVRFEEVPF